MNCRACGTPLPEGAIHCPRCGAATSYYSATTAAAPDDPTVASSPETAAPLPPPPNVSGLSPYHNPYESYQVTPLAPPPPPLRRPGKRLGIIVGIVLLVLLVVGGGVFAWLRFSTDSATFTTNGTFTSLNDTTTSVLQDGQNKIYGYTEHGVNNGDITGSYTDVSTETIHPDNTGNFSGNETCTCTVEGKSGTLLFSFSGTFTADGSFQGQFFNVQGTGDLANLHGQGTFQGKGKNGSYSGQLHYDA